jgi:hypothetical protein
VIKKYGSSEMIETVLRNGIFVEFSVEELWTLAD